MHTNSKAVFFPHSDKVLHKEWVCCNYRSEAAPEHIQVQLRRRGFLALKKKKNRAQDYVHGYIMATKAPALARSAPSATRVIRKKKKSFR